MASSLQSCCVPVVAGASRGWEGRDVAGQLPAHAFAHLNNSPFCSRAAGFRLAPSKQDTAVSSAVC